MLPADWTVSRFFGGGLHCQDSGVMTAACGPWPTSVLGTVAALCWAAVTFSVPPFDDWGVKPPTGTPSGAYMTTDRGSSPCFCRSVPVAAVCW